MRRFLVLVLVCVWAAAPAVAQDAPPKSGGAAGAGDSADTDASAGDDDSIDEEDEEDDEESVHEGDADIRVPDLSSMRLGSRDAADSEADADEADTDEGHGVPPSSDPTLPEWTSPRSVFTLHGYFRLRGELQDKFFLGRLDAPFNYFLPGERYGADPETEGALPAGGCKGDPSDGEQACGTGSDRLRFASMRLRLQPTLAISDDIRLHMMVDVFDNLVLGSTPETKVFDPDGNAVTPGTDTSTGGTSIDTLSNTLLPNQGGRNSLNDSILVRRAWVEITNRGLGQLRLGRMGHHWGLGMVWNDGAGIDSDFSSEIDRVMGITKYKGFFFGASWDFPNEGAIFDPVTDARGIPFDFSQKDDVRQFSFLIARRMDPDKQLVRLRQGKWVLNGGLYFVMRKQRLSSALTPLGADGETFGESLVRRNARVFVPDLWLQVLWKDLRLETEVAFIGGRLRNVDSDAFMPVDVNESSKFKLRQWGWAFETEYRALQRKLAVWFRTGIATGDPDVNGLSARENTARQQTRGSASSTKITHFSFHPNYRVDLILLRNILGRIGGVWYFNPAIAYDAIRTDAGQVAGGRFDLIYTRAMREQQTYGSEPNLGVELNFSAYYRTEDGPDFFDGYFIQFQYGVLFPLAGLKFRTINGATDPNARSVGRAQTFRLLMGVEF